MSEKEKMLSGEIYISADKELTKARTEARDYSQAFNRTTELDGSKRKAIFLDCAEIRFGDNVLVGPNCSFLTPVHPMHGLERRHVQAEDGTWYTPEYAKPITIGNDVWICGNVVINGGVTIGNGSVIASGSVVTKDIPSYCFAAGNPCKVIRKITDDDFILE